MRHGLGVGLDLPWRGPYGIVNGQVSGRTQRFFQRYAHRFSTVFVSWQPRGKGIPVLSDVTHAWDPFFASLPIHHRTLHQTALNLAGADYNREPLIGFTNRLTDRYQMQWVNEDLGSWSVRGRPLPYPQPPPLTDDGVSHCAQVCASVDHGLNVPLVVEFPGFETPAPWRHGTLDAYDAFRQIVEQAGVFCTLDTGHLLTWRWLLGHRGEALFADLDRLPLDRCIEIHCSGTIQTGDQLIDAHHGVLLDDQLKLTSLLMARCANLRVVTYEDPRFNDAGQLPEPAERSLNQLETRVNRWMNTPESPVSTPGPDPAIYLCTADPSTPWEDELDHAFRADDAFGRRCRSQLFTRSARGLGKLGELYAHSISAWREAHGSDLDGLLKAFFDSPMGAAWSGVAWAVPGRCVEDAFGRFVAPNSPEHLTACAQVLAIYPDPPFQIPDGFRRAPQGWFAVSDTSKPVLYAALNGQRVVGAITPMLAQILAGGRPNGGEQAVKKLEEMGLIVG